MLNSYLMQMMRTFLLDKLLGLVRDIPYAEDEVEKNMKKALIQQEAIVKGKCLKNLNGVWFEDVREDVYAVYLESEFVTQRFDQRLVSHRDLVVAQLKLYLESKALITYVFLNL